MIFPQKTKQERIASLKKSLKHDKVTRNLWENGWDITDDVYEYAQSFGVSKSTVYATIREIWKS